MTGKLLLCQTLSLLSNESFQIRLRTTGETNLVTFRWYPFQHWSIKTLTVRYQWCTPSIHTFILSLRMSQHRLHFVSTCFVTKSDLEIVRVLSRNRLYGKQEIECAGHRIAARTQVWLEDPTANSSVGINEEICVANYTFGTEKKWQRFTAPFKVCLLYTSPSPRD